MIPIYTVMIRREGPVVDTHRTSLYISPPREQPTQVSRGGAPTEEPPDLQGTQPASAAGVGVRESCLGSTRVCCLKKLALPPDLRLGPQFRGHHTQLFGVRCGVPGTTYPPNSTENGSKGLSARRPRIPPIAGSSSSTHGTNGPKGTTSSLASAGVAPTWQRPREALLAGSRPIGGGVLMPR